MFCLNCPFGQKNGSFRNTFINTIRKLEELKNKFPAAALAVHFKINHAILEIIHVLWK